MSIIGERIKELRLENNLTQKKLAQMAEISEISIRKYESGDRIPKYDVIEKLSSIFNVQPDYILGRSNQRKFDSNILSDDFKALLEIIESSNNPEFSKLIRNIVDTMFLTIYHDSKEGNFDRLLIIYNLYRNIFNLKISLKHESDGTSFLPGTEDLIKKQTDLINNFINTSKSNYN